MLEILIREEMNRYNECEARLMDLLNRERESLERYAQSENPKPAYVARMNNLLATMAGFQEAAENLVVGIMTVRQLVTTTEDDLRRRLKKQVEENEVLKHYLRELGYDPALLPYMRIRDFQY